MLLFCKFFVVSTVVIGFISDVPDPSVMRRPPREPGSRIANRGAVIRWLLLGLIVGGSALAVLAWGPGEPSPSEASVAMTMAFGVAAIELPMLQRALDTTSLSGGQWLVVLALSLAAPLVVELDKAVLRRGPRAEPTVA